MTTPGALLFLTLIHFITGQVSGDGNSTNLIPWTSIFKCGLKNCPFGQDCLIVSGTQMCVDPCDHYTILNNPKRSVSYTRYPDVSVNDCNVKWEGWHRLLLGGLSAKMPEDCVEEYMCGTFYPLWLNGRHPRPEEGVVPSKICGVSGRSCCHYNSNDIHVKACPGNFFIYKFVVPNVSPSAYCALVPTVPSTIPPTIRTRTTRAPDTTTYAKPTSATTTPEPGTTKSLDEDTVMTPPESNTMTPLTDTTTAQKPGTTTSSPVPSPATPQKTTPALKTDPVTEPTTISMIELVCERSLFRVVVVTSQLLTVGLDASSVHLADPTCSAHGEVNGVVWCQVERKEGSCGNTLKTNGTHAIFSNYLFLYPLARGAFLPRPVRIPFSCVYPMVAETSLDVALRPHLSTEGAGLVGVGSTAIASMSLYRDSNYTNTFPVGQRVVVPLGSPLYVGVSVNETETERFVTVLDDCYVTHSPSPYDLMRYYLIQGKCASDRRRVAVEESGSSLKARFSALLFLYWGDYQDVFLHCRLSLCDRRRVGFCTPMCLRRTSRSVSQAIPLKPLTIGPIAWDQYEVSDNYNH
ncbi:pancreatic secretory granule membrane major glycoprotein GP2-like [Esox lucius]|uniref:pancreatic secretory granule membrane major glycoprotein GP2-like n=1 Tax=Esox lucius TaxID=8010 RepID=UPI0014768576|nr:pancreatic secretory granule membrane major glycoprotein GP2-like [Esox lucius]